MKVETSTPPNTPTPIGPYNHIAKAGQFISIGGTAGVNPATGQLAGPDVYAQTQQILDSFAVMLASVGSDLRHALHINIFLKDMSDFEEMNRAYVEKMGGLSPGADGHWRERAAQAWRAAHDEPDRGERDDA